MRDYKFFLWHFLFFPIFCFFYFYILYLVRLSYISIKNSRINIYKKKAMIKNEIISCILFIIIFKVEFPCLCFLFFLFFFFDNWYTMEYFVMSILDLTRTEDIFILSSIFILSFYIKIELRRALYFTNNEWLIYINKFIFHLDIFLFIMKYLCFFKVFIF